MLLKNSNKYEDEKVYSIFKIINNDYSKALYNCIYKTKLFDKDCLIIRCFFHISQTLIRKMKELKLFNKKLNKVGFEILLNIQIISFWKQNLIQKNWNFEKIIKNLIIKVNYLNICIIIGLNCVDGNQKIILISLKV